MAPRKVDTSSKKAVVIRPRGRPKLLKPVLRTPSVVKVQLKLPSSTTNNANNVDVVVQETVNKATKPVPKENKVLKRKYVRRNVLNEEQSATKVPPTRKRHRIKGAAKNGPKSTMTNETKGAAQNKSKVSRKNDTSVEKGTVTQDDCKYDIPIVHKGYYECLLANEVIKAQFPKKHKLVKEEPAEPKKLQNTKIIVKQKQVSTTGALKEKVTNGRLPVLKTRLVKGKMCALPQKTSQIQTQTRKSRKNSTLKEDGVKLEGNKKNNKQAKQSKQIVSQPKSSKQVECKPKLKSPPKDKNNIQPTKTLHSNQQTKHKHNLSLNQKVKEAGPDSQKNLETEKETLKNKIVNNSLCSLTKDQDIDNEPELNSNFDNSISMDQTSVSSYNSWTRDVSSSNNSSLITVHSNGLHCFDNKIPVLQLNKVNQMLKDKKKSSELDDYYSLSRTDNERKRRYRGRQHRLSGTSSSSSNQTKYAFRNDINKIDNAVIEANTADMIGTSVRLSTSSTSSLNFSSTSSATTSCKRLSQKKINNELRTKINDQDRYGKNSVINNSILKSALTRCNVFEMLCDFSKIKLSKNTYTSSIKKTYLKNQQDEIIRDLKEETILGILCESVAQIEIDNVNKYLNLSKNQEKTNVPRSKTPETYLSKDDQIINEHINTGDEYVKKNNTTSQQHCPSKEINTSVAANETPDKKDSSSHLTHNKSTSYVDNDDDDALSLFAESITGIEPSRRNSTFNSEMSDSEEYVPQPVVPHQGQSRTTINYQPTKIVNNLENELPISESNTQVEQESQIESDDNQDKQENFIIYEDRVGAFTQILPKATNTVVTTKPITDPNKPRLIALNYKAAVGVKSEILKGYCFFYITNNNCKKLRCTFAHGYPDVNSVKNTLRRINETSFIQEYMLVRSWKHLKSKYGICFVEESIKRDLPRILVEIAIDFIPNNTINSAEDNVLRSEVVDNTLMYLNDIDLSVCEDLLQYKIKYDGKVLLCDYFMSVVAMSQNFSRFKSVFIKLTDFMYRIERIFSVVVAESLVERFCILPYDDLLVRALLKILKNTDSSVFSNSNISKFERKLRVSNRDLYDELRFIKDRVLLGQSSFDNDYEHLMYEPQRNMDVDKTNLSTNLEQTDISIKKPSPDSARLDVVIEPTFKRTININKLQNLGFGKNSNSHSATQGAQNSINHSQNLNKHMNHPQKPMSHLPSVSNVMSKLQRIPKRMDQRQAEHVTQSPAGKNHVNWMKPNISGNHTNTDNVVKDIVVNTRKWKHRSIFNGNGFKRTLNVSLSSRPQQAPFKRQRLTDWSFEENPRKFRRTGPPIHHQRDML